MTTRVISGQETSTLTYDAENRLVSVSGAATASFVYDGDNQRVKGTVGGVTTYYAGKHYEVAGGVVKKYYYAGNQRVAMRDGGALYPLLGDRAPPGRGSTAYTLSPSAGSGQAPSEIGKVRSKAFGATRFTSGATPTTYRYTLALSVVEGGQREEASLGLYYYGARWYDPALNIRCPHQVRCT
jgi:hypothetical protein